MCGNKHSLGFFKSGFTIIELVFTIALLAIVTLAIVTQNFGNHKTGYERKTFIVDLNGLVAEGWQQGLMTNKLQKIVFDFNKRIISLEQESDEKDSQGQQQFTPVVIPYRSGTVSWPETFDFKQFFVQGKDELSQHQTTDSLWFFIQPGGLAQEVIINIEDMQSQQGRERTQLSLVLNPFTSQFKVYYEFRIPA